MVARMSRFHGEEEHVMREKMICPACGAEMNFQ
jgi:ribosomal protein S27AE